MQIFFCRSVSPQAKRKQSVRKTGTFSGQNVLIQQSIRNKTFISGQFTELPLDFGDIGHAEIVRDMDFT